MPNRIDLTQPVAKILEKNPELQPILVDMGFKPLNNPLMLKTLGQTTSLKTGAKLIKLPLEDLVLILTCHGYDVVKGDENDR